MKHFVFVRHGQSQHHVSDLTGGWTDTPLTEHGEQQAAATGAYLAEFCEGTRPPILTSDLKRAAMTAAAIGRALDLEPIADADLRELNNGDAAGLTEQQAEAIAIPISEPIIDWQPYPNAESWGLMTERVWRCMDRIHAAVDDVIIVGHGNMGVIVIAWWLQLDTRARSGINFGFDPCSVSEGRINEWGERALLRLNDVKHLFVQKFTSM
ncbi:MAG: histidine phosphatase family protein [Gammaproteobacteria bacterium]|nr:histidine phosphatase family protein [Gammaproteobacteria bacterium]